MTALADTSARLAALGLTAATLLVDEGRARANIARFVGRAAQSGVTLRPHFKTHQSADVARWFADAGVTAATVSSPGQAAYFADHGWRDLTVAIGLNPREVARYHALASRCDLGVTVDHPAPVAALARAGTRCKVWVELDTGDGRAGIPWDDAASLAGVVGAITAVPTLAYAGLLTHAGRSYGRQPADAAVVFAATVDRLTEARSALQDAGLPGGALSAGDTPGFAAVPDWRGLDEARPGNFVFHDLMQLDAGACGPSQLACAVAAPVIGVYPRRGQVVVHAGAVHLGKDAVATPEGPLYGRLLTLTDHGFGDLAPDGRLVSLSQEHGVIACEDARSLQPGDLLLIVPAHSCLTCEQFGRYLTTSGQALGRYRRQ
jgi:D-serine deaminase-like pyridoxal phosphate-dependent protein